MQCWQAYSIVTDMYQPNPKATARLAIRTKVEWLRMSAHHSTWPDKKWVEVQIRTDVWTRLLNTVLLLTGGTRE